MRYREFLKARGKECPFCNGKERIIAERKHAYLTYSMAPHHKHHLLVIPRRHVITMLELTEEEHREISELSKEGTALLNKLGYPFLSYFMRDGVHPGKTVEHLHYHLMPNIEMRPRSEINLAQMEAEDHREFMTDTEAAKLLEEFKQAKNS